MLAIVQRWKKILSCGVDSKIVPKPGIKYFESYEIQRNAGKRSVVADNWLLESTNGFQYIKTEGLLLYAPFLSEAWYQPL